MKDEIITLFLTLLIAMVVLFVGTVIGAAVLYGFFGTLQWISTWPWHLVGF
jgi:uncharacterized MnhB-related membrane protein